MPLGCTGDAQCDDGNACTEDTCSTMDGGCVNPIIPGGQGSSDADGELADGTSRAGQAGGAPRDWRDRRIEELQASLAQTTADYEAMKAKFETRVSAGQGREDEDASSVDWIQEMEAVGE